MKSTFLLALFVSGAVAQDVVWAPKPDHLPGYAPPHKPITRLADLKEKHRGQSDWREVLVDDDLMHGEWISSAPGTKVPKRIHPDTREFWIVQEGQIRFEIEGQQPFIASSGWMVQVPMETFYSMETVGDTPSLRWEVNVAHASTYYADPKDAPAMPGFHWMPVGLVAASAAVQRARTPGVYEHGNKPYVTFAELARNREEKRAATTQRVVQDDRETGAFIYGYEKELPPLDPNDKGHYHTESSEFWLIMSGQIRYPIEGQGVFTANAGDLVYVPRNTFHYPRFSGPGPSCRFAMNGYPNIAHLFEVKAPAGAKAIPAH